MSELPETSSRPARPLLLTNMEMAVVTVTLIAVIIGATIGADAIGLVAATIPFVLFVPQAIKAYEMRGNTEGMAVLSPSTQILVIANATVWAIYGMETKALWVAAPGLVNGPLAILMLVLILRSRLAVDKANHEKNLAYDRLVAEASNPDYGEEDPFDISKLKDLDAIKLPLENPTESPETIAQEEGPNDLVKE